MSFHNGNLEPGLQNYLSLQILLHNKVIPLLQRKLLHEWDSLTLLPWENGRRFVEMFGQSDSFKYATQTQLANLRSGDIRKWDLSLLVMALRALNGSSTDSIAPSIYNQRGNRNSPPPYLKELENITRVRNELSHLASLNISDTDCFRMKKRIQNILKSRNFIVADGTMLENSEDFSNTAGPSNHGNHTMNVGRPQGGVAMDGPIFYVEPELPSPIINAPRHRPVPQSRGFFESLFSCFSH